METFNVAIDSASHTTRHRNVRCGQLFLIYQGLLGRLPLSPVEFIRAIKIHDRNLMFFRDPQKLLYQRGISRDIPTMAGFLEWQKAQRAEHFPHVHTTYCLGASVGACAAIASGYFLKVPIVWAFAPPILEFKGPPVDLISEQCRNLVNLLKQDNGITEYRVFYNERHTRDRDIAQRLGECPGVKLFPQAGEEHQVLLSMHRMSQLSGLLVPFVSI